MCELYFTISRYYICKIITCKETLLFKFILFVLGSCILQIRNPIVPEWSLHSAIRFVRGMGRTGVGSHDVDIIPGEGNLIMMSWCLISKWRSGVKNLGKSDCVIFERSLILNRTLPLTMKVTNLKILRRQMKVITHLTQANIQIKV